MVIDALRSKRLWSQTIPNADGNGSAAAKQIASRILDGGSKFVYVATVTMVPAQGLQDSYVTRMITAYDAQTGKQQWQQPLAPEIRNVSDTDGWVYEASDTAGHTQAVVHVDDDDFSTFDADTGAPLWRVPYLKQSQKANPPLIGYNLILLFNDDNTTDTVTGLDPSTGNIVWANKIDPASTAMLSPDSRVETVGTVRWYFGSEGYDALDVGTGQQIQHGVYPTSWTNVISTPELTVANVDGTLRLYTTGSWATPLWSVPASAQADAVLLTRDTVVVNSTTGSQLLLSTKTGSSLPYPVIGPTPAQGAVVDGLSTANDGIVEYSLPSVA